MTIKITNNSDGWLDKVISFVIKKRWTVLTLILGMTALGIYNGQRLLIDAVPDITKSTAVQS